MIRRTVSFLRARSRRRRWGVRVLDATCASAPHRAGPDLGHTAASPRGRAATRCPRATGVDGRARLLPAVRRSERTMRTRASATGARRGSDCAGVLAQAVRLQAGGRKATGEAPRFVRRAWPSRAVCGGELGARGGGTGVKTHPGRRSGHDRGVSGGATLCSPGRKTQVARNGGRPSGQRGVNHGPSARRSAQAEIDRARTDRVRVLWASMVGGQSSVVRISDTSVVVPSGAPGRV